MRQEYAGSCHGGNLAFWPVARSADRVGARVLFLPQRPYLPIGTLREVVSYPMPTGGCDDAILREALLAVGLPGFAERLSEAGHWALQLSPGEQQRIAFARALVQKPEWLFLDEATSAVDEATEARLVSTGARAACRHDCIQHRSSGDIACVPRSPAFGAGQRGRDLPRS